jgi:hypothetical protein
MIKEGQLAHHDPAVRNPESDHPPPKSSILAREQKVVKKKMLRPQQELSSLSCWFCGNIRSVGEGQYIAFAS